MKLESKTTKGLELKGIRNNKYGYPSGFTSGLTHKHKYNKRMNKGVNHARILAVFLIGIVVLSAIAVLTWQNNNASVIKVDGNFEDWQGIEKTSKARNFGVPENIDIAEYATAESGKSVAFYAKVYGNLLAGDGRYIVEAPSENPVYVANQRETAIPNANGRDVAYVFIDTDNNAATGFKPSQNFAVGADKAIEIVGKNGKIEASRVLTFAGVVQQEWTWNIGDSVAAATNGREMETMAGKNTLGIGETYAVYYYMVDWKFSVSTTLQYTELSSNGKTSYHDIVVDGDLGEWQADENMGGKDNVNWYLTWNANNLYIGVDRGEAFHGGTEEDVLWIYMDTASGGGSTSVDWNGWHNFSFYADWCFVYAPGRATPYWNLRMWDSNAGAWLADQSFTGGVAKGSQTAEIAIPFADIGNPTQVNILFYITNGANNYLFGASPKENPTGDSPKILNFTWIENINSGVAPNEAMKRTVPFAINGDSALIGKAAEWGWDGDGSESNPYIIKNYKISTYSGTYGISLQNTNLHVVIKNCELENVSGGTNSAGISLITATNVTIQENIVYNHTFGIWLQTSSVWNTVKNNTVYGNRDGIRLTTSRNNIVLGNEAFGNSRAGIYLTGTKPENNTIANNTIYNNAQYGIYFASSYANNTTIINNDIYSNTQYGIYFATSSYANNTTIIYNNIYNHGTYGIYITSSSFNNITHNRIYQNTNYGIYLTSTSANNYICYNNFTGNNGATKGTTDGKSQAYDAGTGNLWYNNTAQEGNYWSNWDGKEWGTASAYPIAGGAGASDWYPLSVPEFSQFPVFALLVLCIGVLSILYRRRQK
ncbi:MAG: NosD domain-containing protein [Thermoplasmata archaeon]